MLDLIILGAILFFGVIAMLMMDMGKRRMTRTFGKVLGVIVNILAVFTFSDPLVPGNMIIESEEEQEEQEEVEGI